MLEMSLEEQALRHADAFFTGPEKWIKNAGSGPNGEKCLGVAVLCGLDANGHSGHVFGKYLDSICGCNPVQFFNDACPSFAALKAHLRTRIEYYTEQRLSHSYLVIIGPGRQVRL